MAMENLRKRKIGWLKEKRRKLRRRKEVVAAAVSGQLGEISFFNHERSNPKGKATKQVRVIDRRRNYAAGGSETPSTTP